MGTKALRKRGLWQDVSGIKAGVAENSFQVLFSKHFEGTSFRIRAKPKEFKDIYSQVALHESVLAEIYKPDVQSWIHGVVPDFAIDNVDTKKTLYVEVKRQDGWVEGKQKNAGRGNAHERMCKYFTPGLLNMLRSIGNLGDEVLPFWVVLQGDVARDPKRVREITFWFDQYANHFHMWTQSANGAPVLRHFDEKLKHLLL